jgi:hypothetical protein
MKASISRLTKTSSLTQLVFESIELNCNAAAVPQLENLTVRLTRVVHETNDAPTLLCVDEQLLALGAFHAQLHDVLALVLVRFIIMIRNIASVLANHLTSRDPLCSEDGEAQACRA